MPAALPAILAALAVASLSSSTADASSGAVLQGRSSASVSVTAPKEGGWSATTAGAGVAQAFRDRRLTEARIRLEDAIARARPSELGPRGGPLHLWRELIDLADCVPLTLEQRQDFVPVNRWEMLIGLARLERMRLERSRLGGEPGADVRGDLGDGDFFDRSPIDSDSDVVRWPHSEELWDDERPLPAPVEPLCNSGGQQNRRPVRELVGEELALASSLLEGMTSEDPGWASLHLLRASLLVGLGEVDAALNASFPLSSAPSAVLAADESDAALLLEAMREERDGKRDTALELYSFLVDSPHLVSSREFVESRILWGLAASERWEALLERVPESPRLDTGAGRYLAWLRGRALSELDRVAELFDHARSVLRHVPRYADDEALSLLADLVHVRLSRVPFDDRVIELLESMGPPRDLYPRMERFARVAIERGRHGEAKAALDWLLLHHEAAHVHPRYHALLALVAFESGRPLDLRRWLTALTVPPEPLLRVIPSSRRGAFWRERDRELLGLVSILVPRLPERSRRIWATVVADTLEPFLRDAPESTAHAPLTELYRTVRGLLKEEERGWAERIGATSPPLILGEVVIERPEPQPPPPRAPLRLDEPRFLVRVPVGADPSETTAWLSSSNGEARPPHFAERVGGRKESRRTETSSGKGNLLKPGRRTAGGGRK